MNIRRREMWRVPGDANGRWCRLFGGDGYLGRILRLFIGNRGWWVIVVALAACLAARGAATHSLKPLIDAVIRNGPDSQLPAHLSVMIGVSQVEQTTAVKQAVVRDGAIVRTFNVCVANHDDVVIMVHNEQSRSTKAYLSSPTG